MNPPVADALLAMTMKQTAIAEKLRHREACPPLE
jgi:hypothetical protein